MIAIVLVMMTMSSALCTKVTAERSGTEAPIRTEVATEPEGNTKSAIPPTLISATAQTTTTPSLDMVEMVTSAGITDRQTTLLVGTPMKDIPT